MLPELWDVAVIKIRTKALILLEVLRMSSCPIRSRRAWWWMAVTHFVALVAFDHARFEGRCLEVAMG
jgi:hypothetical protein